MELSKRMKINADLVAEGESLADIGCDHAYASIYLARGRKCPKIIAMDVVLGPLSQAKKNIKRYGLEDVISCRLSDGLEKLSPGEVDTVLIAGMGGMLICQILTQYPQVTDSLKAMVLQAQSDYEAVRKMVYSLGFIIEKEVFSTDNQKPYLAMRCIRGQEVEAYKEAEWAYGRMSCQEHPEEYKLYLKNKIRKLQDIRNKLLVEDSEKAQIRAQELHQEVSYIQEVIS
ncbi:MAG: class I SAM-dependent methyltransferase [Eubacterium sp.]|nr:class I SAM-dependent methyltransferase [Eubacterium sp.]